MKQIRLTVKFSLEQKLAQLFTRSTTTWLSSKLLEIKFTMNSSLTSLTDPPQHAALVAIQREAVRLFPWQNFNPYCFILLARDQQVSLLDPKREISLSL